MDGREAAVLFADLLNGRRKAGSAGRVTSTDDGSLQWPLDPYGSGLLFFANLRSCSRVAEISPISIAYCLFSSERQARASALWILRRNFWLLVTSVRSRQVSSTFCAFPLISFLKKQRKIRNEPGGETERSLCCSQSAFVGARLAGQVGPPAAKLTTTTSAARAGDQLDEPSSQSRRAIRTAAHDTEAPRLSRRWPDLALHLPCRTGPISHRRFRLA